ncbi:hypothetical protein CPC698_0161B, partial [Chlamydia psittaci C6/98]
SFSIRRYSRR